MDKQQVKTIIETLLESIEHTNLLYKKVDELFGVGHSKFIEALWKQEGLLIDTTSDLIGDENHTLSWFIYDNDMGKKKLKHSVPTEKHKMVVVNNITDLLKVLGYDF